MRTHLCPYPSLYPKFGILGESLRWVKRMRMPHYVPMSGAREAFDCPMPEQSDCRSWADGAAPTGGQREVNDWSIEHRASLPTDGTLTELRRLPTSASFQFVCRWIVLIYIYIILKCIKLAQQIDHNPYPSTCIASPLLLRLFSSHVVSCRHGLVEIVFRLVPHGWRQHFCSGLGVLYAHHLQPLQTWLQDETVHKRTYATCDLQRDQHIEDYFNSRHVEKPRRFMWYMYHMMTHGANCQLRFGNSEIIIA